MSATTRSIGDQHKGTCVILYHGHCSGVAKRKYEARDDTSLADYAWWQCCLENVNSVLKRLLCGPQTLSCFLYCCQTNRPSKATKTTKSPIILALVQLYFEPAHCKARKRHVNEGTKIRLPSRSSWLSFSLLDIDVPPGATGFVRNIAIVSIVIPPSGRLIQKHHRQDNFSHTMPQSAAYLAIWQSQNTYKHHQGSAQLSLTGPRWSPARPCKPAAF